MPTTATPQRRAAATRRSAAAKRRAAARRAAATRVANERTPVEQVQEYAERAVLVPVGAALTATDRVAETVTELTKAYSSRETAQKRLERDIKRFERRGTTARNRFERQLKRTRTRVERELRQRRSRVQRVVKRNRTRINREVKRQGRTARKNVEGAVNQAQEALAQAQDRTVA
jgi:exonuclease VII small subunit